MNTSISLRALIYDPFLSLPLRKVRKSVLEFLDGDRNSKILDLCCGTGSQLRLLSSHGFTDLHCLDLSEQMLAVAGRKGGKFMLHHGDAAATGFESGSFDVVILSFALHEKNPPTVRSVLNEAYRIMKESGRLIVADFLFDRETKKAGRLGITLVERMAGGDHYENFRNYRRSGGLSNLMGGSGFREIRRTRAVAGGAVIAMFRKSGNPSSLTALP